MTITQKQEKTEECLRSFTDIFNSAQFIIKDFLYWFSATFSINSVHHPGFWLNSEVHWWMAVYLSFKSNIQYKNSGFKVPGRSGKKERQKTGKHKWNLRPSPRWNFSGLTSCMLAEIRSIRALASEYHSGAPKMRLRSLVEELLVADRLE